MDPSASAGSSYGSAALDPAVAQALQHALGNSNQHRLHDVVRDPYQRRGVESKEFAAIDKRARAA